MTHLRGWPTGLGGAPIVNLFVAGVFSIGLAASWVGIQTVRKGHGYYRRTVVKKALLEDQLGLTKPLENYNGLAIAISSTTGQNEQFQILQHTEDWLKRPTRKTITGGIVFALILFCVANFLGVLGSVWLYLHPVVSPPSCN